MHWDDSFYILEVFFTMFSVLQPAKTAELRQPGSFAHAVKIGGISIPYPQVSPEMDFQGSNIVFGT